MVLIAARVVGRSLMNRQSLFRQEATRATTRTTPPRLHATPMPYLAKLTMSVRAFSSSIPTTDGLNQQQDFDPPKPPQKLNNEIAKGIVDTTHFYIRHGAANQHLTSLSQDVNMPVVTKWQKMMQVFLLTQVHVISGLGYSADEEGLSKYAQDLAQFVQQQTDPDLHAQFVEIRRQTWREVVATCFDIDKNEIPVLSVVEARNFMHKVSSKMILPDVLTRIQQEASNIHDEDPEMEIVLKHQVLQDVIVNTVYLGGNPSLVETSGFGTGPIAYAKVQCAMSDHEGDPLIAQYVGSSMMKLWEAAGLDVSSIQAQGV